VTRRVFACLPLAAVLCIADERSDILDVITPLASALSAGDAAAFLGGFDKDMPGFDKLTTWITGLIDAFEITNSVDLYSSNGDDAELDWSMRLRSHLPGGNAEDRHQLLQVKIGKNRKITSVTPLEFFRPRNAQ